MGTRVLPALAAALALCAFASPALAASRPALPSAAVGSLGGARELRSAKPFLLVGVRFAGTGSVELRARTGRGWTPWVPASEEAPVYTGWSRLAQVRKAGPGSVRSLRVYFVRPGPAPRGQAGALLPQATVRPAMIRRSGWGAQESLRRAPPVYADALKMVFVHHTVTASNYRCSRSAAIVRGIYRFHVLANGWNDIGYNFLIDRCGQVFEGRFGGISKPVIGAHTLGFNTASAGIAMIGTFSDNPPTREARLALIHLIAWRLDAAHVDPLAHARLISAGNPRYHAGTAVVFRAVSGHRDGYPTACPGAALYAELPRVAVRAHNIGLPKIFHPRVSGPIRRISRSQVAPLRFRARLSERLPWMLRVWGPRGLVARASGRSVLVDWTWNGSFPALPGGDYRWTLDAAGTRRAHAPLGTLPDWHEASPPDSFAVLAGTQTHGAVASLARVDGNRLDVKPRARGRGTAVELGGHVAVGAGGAALATRARASFTLVSRGGGRRAIVQLFDFVSRRFTRVGGCHVPGKVTCIVEVDRRAHRFAHFRPGKGTLLRVRVLYNGALHMDSARVFLAG
jgi:hypothetical protein